MNVALIPARAGSKRLPDKNTNLLGGKPLIAWTIEAAIKSGCYDRILVCTDDETIRTADLPRRNDWDVWWRKPVSDTQPDLEWVTDLYTSGMVRDHDTFSILRPTSPWRSAETIRRAWKQWDEIKDRVDSLRAVRPVSDHPGKMWRIGYNGDIWPFGAEVDAPDWDRRSEMYNTATQTLPLVYVQTAGLEIAHARVLPDSISGDRIAPFVLEGAEALDINTPEDWVVAEAYADGRLDPSGQ